MRLRARRHVLSAKLLVAAPGERKKIGDYAGSAPLSAWVRVAAIRVALNLRRGLAAAPHDDDRALATRTAGGDIEIKPLDRDSPRFRGAEDLAHPSN